MKRYVVTWSMVVFEDDDVQTPRDAARCAYGWIRDAIDNDGGANVLVVRDFDTNDGLGAFDEWGEGQDIGGLTDGSMVSS